MTVRSNPRMALVILFAVLYLVLLGLPVSRLAGLGTLGGLPLGMAGLLAVLGRDLPGSRRRSEDHGTMVVAGAVGSGLIYLLATWLDSTSLQLIGLGMFAAVWLAGLFPRPQLDGMCLGYASALRNLDLFPRSQLGGILVLIGVICLPVGFFQGNLLLWLQQLASVMASWALDVTGVAHLRQGVILETVQGTLFVEEACSGMQSLLTGLVVSQVYFCWQKKGLLFSLAGLLCCSAFLILGNCLRIFLIGWLYADHAIDLTKGWKHELTGLGVYLLALALLPSLTGVLDGIGAAWVRWRKPWKRRRARTGESRGETGSPAPRPLKQVLLDGMPARGLWVVITLMGVATVAEALIFRSGDDTGAAIESNGLPPLAKIMLPAELAGWQQDPGGGELSVIGQSTLEQRVWTFRKGAITAWVAAGLPYDELHPLRLCYINRDWAIAREGDLAPQGLLPLSYLELRSRENARAPMLVLYDNYDLASGRFVGGPPDRVMSRLETMSARLKGQRSVRKLAGKGPFCQVQVVQSGVTDHQSTGGRQSLELLTAVRDSLATQLLTPPAH